ncbi:MAG TPA: glycosyltransferase family 4 protein [Gemmatimonadaceae bacterium]|nr:glycosyltransferase family 4 protein [Gemmatimonadaceae bacterium]
MFGWEFPPHLSGGLATATVGLVKGLVHRGVAVTLVVPFPVGEPQIAGLRLVSATWGRHRVRHIRIPSPAQPYGGSDFYLTSRAHLAGTEGTAVYGANLFAEVDRLTGIAGAIAQDEPHDVIHTHDWITYAAGVAARAVSGKPLVAHLHATEFDRAGDGANEWIVARERDGLQAADHVITNSRALKQQAVGRYGVPADHVTAVHWGIDDEYERWDAGPASPLPPDAPIVLFLGRVTRQKGPEYFLDVAGRVAALVPEAHFVVAGTGDLVPRMVTRAAEMGIAHRVHFAGAVAGVEVDRAFQMATVCVMPSVSEPFGLVALESLRAGTPCIVPPTAGVAEVLTHAIKIDFWDLDEMTRTVVGLLGHRDLRDQLAVRGRDEVAGPRFSLGEPARRVEAVYQRAIAAHAGAANA